ncbi:hypothetical protein H9L01_02785 [Erysipelothrix inopinata]|uniref:Uncharacterized protein n=1 Tax=Erysipelothrix inopinata TaxID=225084 RepID=A0A7G9S0D5_9FIRM|nr:hypothetical protein [Erysipelothrix inopinata]QNN61310.1 hypothetical protein H9L01_02785 [Erysipelothrix inopinata]
MRSKVIKLLTLGCVFLLFVTPLQAEDKKISEPGTYEVELKYTDTNGTSSTKTIHISVTKDEQDEEAIIDDHNGKNEDIAIHKISDYILEASNFIVKNQSLDTLTHEEILDLSKARAYNPMTEATTPIEIINKQPLDKNRVEYTLIADEVLIKTVVGTTTIDDSVGKDIQWTNNNIEYDKFTTLNQIFFGSSIFILIIIPLLIISILFIIYYRYKNKTQDILYRAKEEKKNQQ